MDTKEEVPGSVYDICYALNLFPQATCHVYVFTIQGFTNCSLILLSTREGSFLIHVK